MSVRFIPRIAIRQLESNGYVLKRPPYFKFGDEKLVSIGPYTTFDDAIDDLKWLHDNLPHGQIYHKFPRVRAWLKDPWNLKTEADYIVVGAGTSGCITAWKLAQLNPTRTIVLLDAGKPYSNEASQTKMSSWFDNWSSKTIVHESESENFLPSVATSHIGVGGCGAHDTRITFRPSDAQMKRYCQTFGWTDKFLKDCFDEVLKLMPIKSSGCGEKFYDAVLSRFCNTNTNNKTFNSIQHYDCTVKPNTIGYVSLAMYDNESRWSSALLLEKPQPNLKVVTQFTVDRVIFDETKRATGVLGADGKEISLKNDNSNTNGCIVITAGSIGTPAILQRSGIGPKRVLDELGITPVVECDEVGHGVDHMEVPVLYTWNDKWNEDDGSLPRGGPMAWPLVMFFDNEQVMAHFGISPPPYGGKEITITPNCMRPDSNAGFRVQIVSKDPLVPAKLIHASEGAYRKDFETLAKGIQKTVSTFDPLIGDVFGPRIAPTNDILKNNDKLMEYVKTHLGTAYHWMSTCKSGMSAEFIADDRFRVRGVSNLRVGSGACLPEIPVANPHLTISAFSVALAKTITNDKATNIRELGTPRGMFWIK